MWVECTNISLYVQTNILWKIEKKLPKLFPLKFWFTPYSKIKKGNISQKKKSVCFSSQQAFKLKKKKKKQQQQSSVSSWNLHQHLQRQKNKGQFHLHWILHYWVSSPSDFFDVFDWYMCFFCHCREKSLDYKTKLSPGNHR